MDSEFVYSDQELMTDAVNYRNFLFSLVKPYIKGRILEIGSGLGNMTSLALANPSAPISSYTCVEPEKSCTEALEKLMKKSAVPHKIINGRFPESVSAEEKGNYDLLFSYNVMEHIEDDIEAFRISNTMLAENGTLFLFVPAFMCLFGSMDEQLKHFRRYSKTGLTAKLKNAGFEIEKIRYCNLSGFFAWFLNNRILKIKSQKASQIALFDKVILPAQKVLESLINPPFGQNIYAVARKKH